MPARRDTRTAALASGAEEKPDSLYQPTNLPAYQQPVTLRSVDRLGDRPLARRRRCRATGALGAVAAVRQCCPIVRLGHRQDRLVYRFAPPWRADLISTFAARSAVRSYISSVSFCAARWRMVGFVAVL